MKHTEDALSTRQSFEDVVLPHLDAAYRLARWLLGNEHDAEDVVQEAALRAFRYFGTFSGGNGRAWFLQIVRHLCWSCRGAGRPVPDSFDEERHSGGRSEADPETQLIRIDDARSIDRAMSRVPGRWRELLVLREREELSYRELADAVGVPMGTVMSGLSRARQAFRAAWSDELNSGRPRRQRICAERRSRGSQSLKRCQGDTGSDCGSAVQ
jgi:RNA polymerase sigma-70 factor (ECF subfamily)